MKDFECETELVNRVTQRCKHSPVTKSLVKVRMWLKILLRPVRSFARSFVRSFVPLFVPSSPCFHWLWLVAWLADWLVGWMVELARSLIDSLGPCVVDSLGPCFYKFSSCLMHVRTIRFVLPNRCDLIYRPNVSIFNVASSDAGYVSRSNDFLFAQSLYPGTVSDYSPPEVPELSRGLPRGMGTGGIEPYITLVWELSVSSL